MLYTVRGLRDLARGVNIRVRIIEKYDVRTVRTKDGTDHNVVDAKVGDRTGSVILTLWDETIEEFSEGDLIDIKKGYVRRFKGRLRLNVGKYGSIERVEDKEFPTREELLSKRQKK